MLPTAGARMSTPVSSMNLCASSGVVKVIPCGTLSRISDPLPMSPISPSMRSEGLDRLQPGDGRLSFRYIRSKGQLGTIEDNRIVPSEDRFFRARQRMCVIGVQEYRKVILIADALDGSADCRTPMKARSP